MSDDRAGREEVPLLRPVMAHGEMVPSLWLRRPNAGDCARAGGYPFNFAKATQLAARGGFNDLDDGALPDLDWNLEVLLSMISIIADVPRSTVNALDMLDIPRLQGQILTF